MAVRREDGVLRAGGVVLQVLDQVAVLAQRGVAGRVGNVQRGRARLNGRSQLRTQRASIADDETKPLVESAAGGGCARRTTSTRNSGSDRPASSGENSMCASPKSFANLTILDTCAMHSSRVILSCAQRAMSGAAGAKGHARHRRRRGAGGGLWCGP